MTAPHEFHSVLLMTTTKISTCPQCGVKFQNKSNRAKWCSSYCRCKAHRIKWRKLPSQHKNTDFLDGEKRMLQKILNEHIQAQTDSGRDIDPILSSLAEKIGCICTEETFFQSIYDLLLENRMLPFNLPSVSELRQLKGGYKLMIIISEKYGGLREIRPRYMRFASQLFFKSQPQINENIQS